MLAQFEVAISAVGRTAAWWHFTRYTDFSLSTPAGSSVPGSSTRLENRYAVGRREHLYPESHPKLFYLGFIEPGYR